MTFVSYASLPTRSKSLYDNSYDKTVCTQRHQRFSPLEVQRRNYIIYTIRQVFETFGYQPIETPVMENLKTLTGKYGDEGDKLLFKVLNNGDYLSKADQAALDARDSKRLLTSISRRGLRYDLTVPFARYVVMHQHEISFPFKRYQIQPVCVLIVRKGAGIRNFINAMPMW